MDVVTGRELHHAASPQLSQRFEELVLTEVDAPTPEPIFDAGPDGPYSPDAFRHAVRPQPQPLGKLLIPIECTAELRQPLMRQRRIEAVECVVRAVVCRRRRNETSLCHSDVASGHQHRGPHVRRLALRGSQVVLRARCIRRRL